MNIRNFAPVIGLAVGCATDLGLNALHREPDRNVRHVLPAYAIGTGVTALLGMTLDANRLRGAAIGASIGAGYIAGEFASQALGI